MTRSLAAILLLLGSIPPIAREAQIPRAEEILKRRARTCCTSDEEISYFFPTSIGFFPQQKETRKEFDRGPEDL